MKRALEAGLLHLGPAAVARARMRGRALVLAYHNIVPRGEVVAGDPSLHLPQDRFADQLDVLQEECDVVSLAEVLVQRRDTGRPSVAITFDDAYAGALAAGGEELALRSLPATVFVSPGLLGGRTFWWDATGASPATGWRREAIEVAFGHPGLVRERWAAGGGAWRNMPEHARSASEIALRAFMELPGMGVAAHGWLHLNLVAAPAPELATELRAPAAWLGEHHPTASTALAYPYGLASPAVERAAADAGYEAALLVSGGWLPPPGVRRAFAEPRLNVPAGVSLAGFRLRIAGLLGG